MKTSLLRSLLWFFIFATGSSSLTESASAGEPLMINQILIDPIHPDILYAGARPQGLLKSIDRGKTWLPARIGLKNTSVYPMVLDPGNTQILYLGTFGGGVYKSQDGAARWTEINDGLGNTNIHALAIDPLNSNRIVAGTSTGELYQTNDGGAHWVPDSQGLPSLTGELIITLRFDGAPHSRLFLGEERLFVREEGEPWKSLGEGLSGKKVTAFEIDPARRIFYAGTLKDGLWSSADGGKQWKLVSPLFQHAWIQRVILSPYQPGFLFVSVIGKGLFKSVDGGKKWVKLEGGLPIQDDVMCLAIDPKEPNRMYVGTHNTGIFLSDDGGSTWSVPAVKQEPVGEVIDSLFSIEANPVPEINVPVSFSKCSKCHGWADLHLSQRKTYWRVSPNHREWRTTVHRMSSGAGLTAEEEEAIILFLNRYSEFRHQ